MDVNNMFEKDVCFRQFVLIFVFARHYYFT